MAEHSNEEASVIDIIDVDAFTSNLDSPDILKPSNMSAGLCKGHVLAYPEGKSPHTCYPFALHDTLVLPWDYMVRNSVMTLFSPSCPGKPQGGFESCFACQQLVKNGNLEGIIERIEQGIHDNSKFAYHGFSGLHEMLHRKNQQIDFYRFHGLNQARKLLAKATTLYPIKNGCSWQLHEWEDQSC
jgi:hypothetical protein